MAQKIKAEKDLYASDPNVLELVAHASGEFEDVCARARAGEFRILQINVGPSPARYTFRVRKLTKVEVQPTLL